MSNCMRCVAYKLKQQTRNMFAFILGLAMILILAPILAILMWLEEKQNPYRVKRA